MIPQPGPAGLPVTQIRLARPTDKLDEVVHHAGYEGVTLGLSRTDQHLEFTAHADGTPGPAPTPENLLVLYIEDPAALAAAITRLRACHAPVPLDTPYWDAVGAVAFADPDGAPGPRADHQQPQHRPKDQQPPCFTRATLTLLVDGLRPRPL
jgi:hypothetical protein